jgi:hypothetical protein
VVEQAYVELVAWARFDTPNFEVAPDLLGRSHIFTFDGHEVEISLPSAERVAGLSEHRMETFSDDRIHIKSWRKQDGRPELLAVGVYDVDVEVGIPGTTLVPEEARTRQIIHDPYSEQQKEHLNKLASDYSNLARSHLINREAGAWTDSTSTAGGVFSPFSQGLMLSAYTPLPAGWVFMR